MHQSKFSLSSLKTPDGLHGGRAGLEGERVSLAKFIFNRKRPCFQWAGKINTNPNKEHTCECVLSGTLGRRVHNEAGV